MNFRLRQLIGCKVEIQLEDDQVIRGKICHVGSNFVELIVESKSPHNDTKRKNVSKAEDAEELKDVEETEEQESIDQGKMKRKSQTILFSLDKINHLKHHCGCPGPCICK